MILLYTLIVIDLLWWLFSWLKPIEVINDHIPFKGFLAITIAPVVFSKAKMDDNTLAHEYKHIQQQRRWTPLVFCVLYFLQYLWNLVVKRQSSFNAYWNISLEKQARRYEKDYAIGIYRQYGPTYDLRRKK
jgi:hypothetical protein